MNHANSFEVEINLTLLSDNHGCAPLARKTSAQDTSRPVRVLLGGRVSPAGDWVGNRRELTLVVSAGDYPSEKYSIVASSLLDLAGSD